MATKISFSYEGKGGLRNKTIKTSDTPLLALMKFFGRFHTIENIKTINGSTALVECVGGAFVVFDIAVEGKRGPKPALR